MRVIAFALVLTSTVSCLFGGSISADTSASGTAAHGAFGETIVVPGGNITPGDYANANIDLLVHGNPSSTPTCGPADAPFASGCITQTTSSPEPGGYILLGIALLLLAGGMRRRKSAE